MTTPEQYFAEHPDVAVLADKLDTTEAYVYDDEGVHWLTDEYIDWTGFSRRIAYNPHFAWGKRRAVEWTGETAKYPSPMSECEPRRQLCNAKGEPLNIWEIGRYVDAPIMNAHGHTPSEMVEIIRELRAIAEQIVDRDFKSPPGRSNGQPYYQDRLTNAENLANAMLSKTEDFR